MKARRGWWIATAVVAAVDIGLAVTHVDPHQRLFGLWCAFLAGRYLAGP